MTDYKAAHLAWISEQTKRGFIPKEYGDWKYNIPYLEMMRFTYSQPNCTQQNAEWFYEADKLWFSEKTKISRDMDKKIQKLIPTPNGCWFITIGFNHQTWTVDKCVKAIQKIINMDWVIRCKANFELFRDNGEHPHCHFYIETRECKSKILDKLWRPNYIKEIVLKRNFIDIKEAGDQHQKYINLEKVDEKMECVKKDKEWRLSNNIPDFEKNW